MARSRRGASPSDTAYVLARVEGRARDSGEVRIDLELLPAGVVGRSRRGGGRRKIADAHVLEIARRALEAQRSDRVRAAVTVRPDGPRIDTGRRATFPG